ncbi:MAG: hypothetical protein AAF585_25800, partial [Verrucomicrobiota bacterium]
VAAGIGANVIGFGLSFAAKNQDGEALFRWDGAPALWTNIFFSVAIVACVVAQILRDRKEGL